MIIPAVDLKSRFHRRLSIDSTVNIDGRPWTLTDAVQDGTMDFLALFLVAAFVYFLAETIRFLLPFARLIIYRSPPATTTQLVDDARATHDTRLMRGPPPASNYGAFLAGRRSRPSGSTYENLLALGDEIGSVSSGLTDEQIDVMPCHVYRESSQTPSQTQSQTQSQQSEVMVSTCAICREPFEDNQLLRCLPCSDTYHSEFDAYHLLSPFR